MAQTAYQATPQPAQSSAAQVEQWRISASQRVTDDPLLDSLVLLSQHFGSPCSADSLAAGLPLTEAVLTPDLLPQAAARAGLTARLTRKNLEQIDPLMLPCLLLLKDKKAALLMAVDHDNDTVTLQLPDSGGQQQLTIPDLQQQYAGYLFLVKQLYRNDKGMAPFLHRREEHWLWHTLRQSSTIYRDALIASVLVNLFALISPLFIMNVYDKVLPNLAFDSLWVLAIGAGIAFLFDLLMRQLRSYLIDVAGKKADIIISSRLFAKAIGMPLAKRSPSVGAMAKQMAEFDSIRDFLTSATITALVDLPFALLFFTVIYLVAGDLVVLPLLGGVLILTYTLLMQPKLKRTMDESNKFSTIKHGHLIESLSAIETIKANNAEGLVQKSWQQMTAHSASWQLRCKKITSSVSNTANLLVQLSVIGVVVLGVYRVADGAISMGGIIAAVILASRAIAPLAQLANLITRANQSISALQQLDTIMQQQDEFDDRGQLLSLERLKGKIELDRVSFCYPGTQRPSLQQLSLTIQPGERIAIIGRNGSGKTTLAKLLCGLLQPEQGHIRYDGMDAAQIHPSDLRRNFGYLPQDVVLFHGSIRDNILFGTRQVSEHQLIRAIELSGVSLFTHQESEGVEQQVGEGGQSLSRGQRQSVALARAILNDPPLLLMDEPTASLDARAEKQFVRAMKNVSTARGMILITHKMHLLKLVDRIIVLDRGHLLADGPRDEVLTQLSEGKLTREGDQ